KVNPKTKGTKKKAKKTVKADPQAILQRKQKYAVRSLFRRLGFDRIRSDGKEFTFRKRTGEVDDIFVYENIIIIAEYTTGKSVTSHVTKKKLLYDLINDNPQEWVEFCAQHFETFPDLAYHVSDYRVRICYFSINAVSEQVDELL